MNKISSLENSLNRIRSGARTPKTEEEANADVEVFHL